MGQSESCHLTSWHFKGCSWSWDQPNWPITAWASGIFLHSGLRKQIFSQNGHRSNVLRNFFHECYSSYVLGQMLVHFMWQDCCCDCLTSSSRRFGHFMVQKIHIQLHFSLQKSEFHPNQSDEFANWVCYGRFVVLEPFKSDQQGTTQSRFRLKLRAVRGQIFFPCYVRACASAELS